MSKEIFIKKYSLNDFFTMIFSMIKYIWKDTIVLSLIFFIPTSILFSFGFTKFMNIMVTFMDNAKSFEGMGNSPEMIFQIIFNLASGCSIILGVILLYCIAKIFVNSFVSLKTYKIAMGENISFNENFMVTLTKYFPKIFFQSILIGLIFTGIIIVFYVVIIVPIIILSIVNNIAFTIFVVLFEILFVLGFIVFIVWFSIKFTFSQYPIICDNSKIVEGIKKSFFFVKGNFWRILGISLLISLILSFALSMVITPIIMIIIMPSYIDLLKNIMNSGGSYDKESIINMYKIFAKMGPVYGISMMISGVVQSLILPVYLCLFYIDLKVRKNELIVPDGSQPQIPINNG